MVFFLLSLSLDINGREELAEYDRMTGVCLAEICIQSPNDNIQHPEQKSTEYKQE